MAVKPLTNAAWGFESNCYVCEPANPQGLRIPFFHDEEAGLVTAEFRLGAEHSGAPHHVHGGVLLAILDEAMAWAAIALAERFAVVQSTATTFDRPVRIDEPYRVEAAVHDRTDTAVTARASVTDAGGRTCARARARLVVMSSAVAGAAIGPVTGADLRYLRPLPTADQPDRPDYPTTPAVTGDAPMSAPEISIDELAAARADGPVPLVDVRQPEEYEAAHVPGAKLIPLADVVARVGEIPTEGPVYVICQSGPRSQRAADFYRNRGIEAYNVAGGTKAWIEAGHEAAHGPFPG